MNKILILILSFFMVSVNASAQTTPKNQCQMQINTKELGAIAQSFILAFANNDTNKAREEQKAARGKIAEANAKHEDCLKKAGYSAVKNKK